MNTILIAIASYLLLSFGGAWFESILKKKKLKQTILTHLLIWFGIFVGLFVFLLVIYAVMSQ